MSKRPILLTCDELLRPIKLAQTTLSEIRASSFSVNESELSRKGYFVLAIASVETMMSDVLLIFLSHIPHKVPSKVFEVGKSDLIDDPRIALTSQVETYVRRISYKSLKEYVDEFTVLLGVDSDTLSSTCLESLVEIKESRNLLLHNGLKANSTYLEKAGPKARASHCDAKLSISSAYLRSSLGVLDEFCNWCASSITEEFAHYTRLKALKGLWDYLFHTPLLKFDDIWQSIPEKDTVQLLKLEFGAISGSERIFLGVWLNHYGGQGAALLAKFDVRHLDSDNQKKLIWLLSVLPNFWLYTSED